MGNPSLNAELIIPIPKYRHYDTRGGGYSVQKWL